MTSEYTHRCRRRTAELYDAEISCISIDKVLLIGIQPFPSMYYCISLFIESVEGM